MVAYFFANASSETILLVFASAFLLVGFGIGYSVAIYARIPSTSDLENLARDYEHHKQSLGGGSL